jgi:hypothetical protein
VTREQRVLAGDPKLGASQNIPNFPYAKHVELLGFKDIRVGSPDHASGSLRGVWVRVSPPALREIPANKHNFCEQ